MSKPLCIAYIRFSSVIQKEGASLERQLEKCLRYAEKHHLDLNENDIYRDLGKSAFSGENVTDGVLGDIISKIQQGEFAEGTYLLVESLDRLSRKSSLDAFGQFQFFLNAGLSVVTLCDEIVYTKQSMNQDFSQLLISLSIMYRANEESESKVTRIRNGYHKLREKLHMIKQTANCPSWLKLSQDRTKFIMLKDKIEVINKIFSLSYDGNGIKQITTILNREKIPAARSSRGWCQSTVRKILSSRAVLGEFQPHTLNPITRKYDPVGEPIIGYFPQIIDEAKFNAVQARLANGTHRAGRTAKIENLFGGITKCGYCGARMDVVTKGKFPNDVRNLVCDGARRGFTECSHVGLKCNELERAFMEYCKENDILELLNIEGKEEEKKSLHLMAQVTSRQGELIVVDRKLRPYVEELEESDDKLEREHIRIRIREFLHKKEKIQLEITVLQKEIDLINSSLQSSDAKVQNILFLYEDAINSLNDADRIAFRSKLRNELRQIVNKVVVFPRGRVYSNDDIEKVRHTYELEAKGLSDQEQEAHQTVRDVEIEAMRSTQTNTKEDRFFTVYFKNGNYRNIKYSPITKTYHVSADRMGDRLEWSMNGKAMKPIDVGDEARLINSEIAQYQKANPNLNLTDDHIEGLRRYLQAEDGLHLNATNE